MHKLPELPYAIDSLSPKLSQETLQYHYGKHHNAYVTNLNKLLEGSEFQDMQLEDIIRKASGPIFNNAAQVWNHTFYWNCLSPKPKQTPGEQLLQQINHGFGSLEAFKDKFTQAAITLFGSGWVWLVKTNGTLVIETTSNAGNPLTNGSTPLMTCDVWEHAYYIDYRNNRAKYVETFWKMLNWDFCEQNEARQKAV